MEKKAGQLDSYFHFPFQNGAPLQVVRWSGQRVAIASDGDSTAMQILPAGAKLIEISATQDCYMAFGDGAVVASGTVAPDGSRLFLAGAQIVVVPLDSEDVPFTHCAVIQAGVAGIVQIEGVE